MEDYTSYIPITGLFLTQSHECFLDWLGSVAESRKDYLRPSLPPRAVESALMAPA